MKTHWWTATKLLKLEFTILSGSAGFPGGCITSPDFLCAIHNSKSTRQSLRLSGSAGK
jgi:hypothetical protein